MAGRKGEGMEEGREEGQGRGCRLDSLNQRKRPQLKPSSQRRSITLTKLYVHVTPGRRTPGGASGRFTEALNSHIYEAQRGGRLGPLRGRKGREIY